MDPTFNSALRFCLSGKLAEINGNANDDEVIHRAAALFTSLCIGTEVDRNDRSAGPERSNVDAIYQIKLRREHLAKNMIHDDFIALLRNDRSESVNQAILNALVCFMVESPDRIGDCANSGLKKAAQSFQPKMVRTSSFPFCHPKRHR